ncbi:MAG: glycosyltransferase family 4 protein [Chloroflexi bacterium]|nr:MAG: glycosyltransferase family 4 protein [Chloroflexota bacterium]
MARPGTHVSKVPVTAVAWARFQPRTVALASVLEGRARFVSGGITAKALATRPLSYLVNSVRTWMLLSRDDPHTVVVITPPVFAPLAVWLWCMVRGRQLVVDCHTGAFHSGKWAWARPIHRVLLRRAKVVLLHTEDAEALVATWGARALLLPDDVPDASDAEQIERQSGSYRRVLVAGSFDGNEPVAEAIAAAELLPDVELRYTGDPELVPAELRAGASPNAVFTGYLPYRTFLGELQSADVVACFSTDPQIMNRAAFEAVGLGRPLVLSDLPGLRSRFGSAALFCANEPAAMARAVAAAIESSSDLAARSMELREKLTAQRDQAVSRLREIIGEEVVPNWRRRIAS